MLGLPRKNSVRRRRQMEWELGASARNVDEGANRGKETRGKCVFR